MVDLALLTYWDTKPHVLAASDDDWGWEEELNQKPIWREQLIAELDGRPIGFLQIIDPALEETKYWGEVGEGFRAIDIWIGEETDLGKGYGTIMMELAFEKCFKSEDVHSILIDPLKTNTRVHVFYQRLGFEFVEERILDGDEVFVYQLSRLKLESMK